MLNVKSWGNWILNGQFDECNFVKTSALSYHDTILMIIFNKFASSWMSIFGLWNLEKVSWLLALTLGWKRFKEFSSFSPNWYLGSDAVVQGDATDLGNPYRFSWELYTKFRLIHDCTLWLSFQHYYFSVPLIFLAVLPCVESFSLSCLLHFFFISWLSCRLSYLYSN